MDVQAPEIAAAPVGIRRLRAPRGRWLVLVLVCAAQFMAVVDGTIVNVALPSIQRGLHFSNANLQWVLNIYTLLFGGFLLLGARAGDLIGRQRLFITGVALFTGASLLNGIAPTSGVLIGGRALQGLGASMVTPTALSIVTTSFAQEGRERTLALGIWSATAAAGGAVGLLLGGVLTDLLSWRWIFFINLPVGAAVVALSLRHIANTRAAQRPQSIDVAGALTATAGLLLLVYDIVKAQRYGWASAHTIGTGAAAIALLVAFVVVERRARAPLVRLGLLRNRVRTGSYVAFLFVIAGIIGMFYFSSLYMQEVLGYNPLRAGIAFLPLPSSVVIGSALAQRLIRRIGVRADALLGIALGVAGLALLRGVSAHGSYASHLLPALILSGIGIGNTFLPVTQMALTRLAPEDAGLGAGLLNISQNLGGALGLAILSTLAVSRTAHELAAHATRPDALVAGFQLAYTVAGAYALTGLLIVACVIHGRDVAHISLHEEGPAESLPPADH